jgi:hypothetical protein
MTTPEQAAAVDKLAKAIGARRSPAEAAAMHDEDVPKARGWDLDDGSPWAAVEIPADGPVAEVVRAVGLDPSSDEDRVRVGYHDGSLFVDGVNQDELDTAWEEVRRAPRPQPREDPRRRELETLWVMDRIDLDVLADKVAERMRVQPDRGK